MAFCKTHPQISAAGRCVACAEEFCNNCLVDIRGQKYCGSCKVLELQGKTPAAALEHSEAGYIPCPAAKNAMICGILSLVCFGFILGPIAIFQGAKARTQIANDPRFSGSGMALAGIILGVIGTIGTLAAIALRVSR